MSTSESELREVLIAMKIPRRPEDSPQSDIAFLYDYIDCVENMADEHYRIIEPASSTESHMIPVPAGRLRAAIGLLEYVGTGKSVAASHCAEVAADLRKSLPAAPGKEG